MADVWHGEAPRNVLSDETIRKALASAASSQSTSSQRTSSISSGRPEERRRSSTTKAPKDANCDCMDCRDDRYRNTAGTTRYDKNGDKIVEADGDARVHCHVQPGLFDEEDAPAPPRRTSTAQSSKSARSDKSSGSSRRRSSEDKNVTARKDSKGDLVQEWNGSDAPKVRAHYDWDKEQNIEYH